jgi:hypothetical protein
VDVLAASDAVRDVFRDRVEVILADAALFERGVAAGFSELTVVLKLRLEESGGATYHVFVDGEALVDVGDSESHDFAAEAARKISNNGVL